MQNKEFFNLIYSKIMNGEFILEEFKDYDYDKN